MIFKNSLLKNGLFIYTKSRILFLLDYILEFIIEYFDSIFYLMLIGYDFIKMVHCSHLTVQDFEFRYFMVAVYPKIYFTSF